MSARAKVLVVGPSWVGDMVMAQALYRVLAARVPSPEIHVLAPPWSLPLNDRMPEVAKSIELAAGHGELKLALRRSLGVGLRAERYDEAIVLPRSLKAALVPWFARIPKRTGFRGEWRYGLLNDVRELDRARLDQTVKRFVALGLDAGAAPPAALPAEWQPRLRVDEANLARLKREHGLGGEPLVALMPGAEYGPAKRWPAGHYASLARALHARDGAPIALLGSPQEAALCAEIAARSEGACRVVAGKASLLDAIALIAGSRGLASNDSGLMHVAAGFGIAQVAVFGSTSPLHTPPLNERARVLWLKDELDLDCMPCFDRTCRFGHYRCLTAVTPERALAALDSART